MFGDIQIMMNCNVKYLMVSKIWNVYYCYY